MLTALANAALFRRAKSANSGSICGRKYPFLFLPHWRLSAGVIGRMIMPRDMKSSVHDEAGQLLT
jgi:hypothetical protein